MHNYTRMNLSSNWRTSTGQIYRILSTLIKMQSPLSVNRSPKYFANKFREFPLKFFARWFRMTPDDVG